MVNSQVINKNLIVNGSIKLSENMKNVAEIANGSMVLGDSNTDIVLSGQNVTLNGSRLILNQTSNTMYGTTNPNELDLRNIKEGTLYFMIDID